MSPIISTFSLTRRFGSINAVKSIDLTVPEHSVFGFLGPNGAGKTTTIRMLLGLLKPSAGEVHLFGSPFLSNRSEILSRVGSLVEIPSLYPHLTGRENLEVIRRMLALETSSISRALSVVDLEKDAARLVKQYSLGMKQRLGLAMAMLGNPELLILDEPTNGLDPAGILEMRELLRRMPKEHGITVFLSSHLLNEIEQIATHIAIIHNGVLLFQGEPGELQKQKHQHLIVEVDRPDEALAVLAKNGWKAERNGDRRLSVQASNKTDTGKIGDLIIRNSLTLYHLSLTESSLEDLFLELTNNRP
jgi:ABC-2 type transport system ATP-binding protein